MTKPGRSPEETLLDEAFAASRRDTYEPDVPADPSRIWWRARAEELVEEEILRRKRTAAPITFVQRLTGAALFLLIESGVLLLLSLNLDLLEEPLEAAGVAPLTLLVVVLAGLPTSMLLHRFQRLIWGV